MSPSQITDRRKVSVEIIRIEDELSFDDLQKSVNKAREEGLTDIQITDDGDYDSRSYIVCGYRWESDQEYQSRINYYNHRMSLDEEQSKSQLENLLRREFPQFESSQLTAVKYILGTGVQLEEIQKLQGILDSEVSPELLQVFVEDRELILRLHLFQSPAHDIEVQIPLFYVKILDSLYQD